MTSSKCIRTGVPASVCSCSLHQRIGGQLDAQAYAHLARRHMPSDIRDAVAELARQGLRAADIARLLELSEPAVTALLQRLPIASSDESAALHRAAWSGQRGEHG